MRYRFLEGFWNRLEMYCRELTKRWNEVHVISGPALRPVTETDPNTGQENKYIKYRVSIAVLRQSVTVTYSLRIRLVTDFEILTISGRRRQRSSHSHPFVQNHPLPGKKAERKR